MSVRRGWTVSKNRIALFGLATWLAIAACTGCSATAPPPSATPATSTTSPTTSSAAAAPIAAPPPVTGALEKDWKSYGGTAYYGCPEQVSLSKTALDDIRPKIFDTKTGQYVAPAVPMIAAGETITGGICALSGTFDATKIIYVVTTSKPAQALEP